MSVNSRARIVSSPLSLTVSLAVVSLFASSLHKGVAFADEPLPPEYDSKCMVAVSQMQKQALGKYAMAAMNVSSYALSSAYSEGYPANKPFNLQIAFSGDGVDTWMYAPDQLQAAKDLIKKCSQISAVTFSVFATDWINVFGMVNNKVTPFGCVEPTGSDPNEKLPWGKIWCQ